MKKPVLVLTLALATLLATGCSKPVEQTAPTQTPAPAVSETTNKTVTANTAETSPKNTIAGTAAVTIEKPVLATFLAKETFSSGLGSWYEQTWYNKKSSDGKVVAGKNGLTFSDMQSDSRSGVMLDLNRDVSGYKKLNLEMTIEVDKQTLSGTGWQGREAPVAVAVSYQANDGSEHNLLGENPSAAGQMFWRGFYYLDPTDKNAGTVNGVKVPKGVPYTYDFDLMSLNPPPKKIYFVALEGAGWKGREGKVSSVSITGN